MLETEEDLLHRELAFGDDPGRIEQDKADTSRSSSSHPPTAAEPWQTRPADRYHTDACHLHPARVVIVWEGEPSVRGPLFVVTMTCAAVSVGLLLAAVLACAAQRKLRYQGTESSL